MYVDSEVLGSAANLIHGGLGDLPVKDEAEWKGLDKEQAKVLGAVLDEITWQDLYEVAKNAAARLPEDALDEDEAEQGDDR